MSLSARIWATCRETVDNIRHSQHKSMAAAALTVSLENSGADKILYLFFLQHVGFSQNLHGVNVSCVFFLHQTHLKETAVTFHRSVNEQQQQYI